MSKLIRDGDLTAFERWELPNVETPEMRARREAAKSARVEDVDEVPAPVTAEQIEAIQKAAYQEGFEQGHKEGLAKGEAEARKNAQRIAQIAQGLSKPLQELDEQLEHELVDLALAIGRELVRRELAARPEQVVDVVREAVGLLPSSSSSIRIFLHPEDAKLVREALSLSEDESRDWRIIEDPVLARGGCRVETDRSRIDATLEKRLETVITELFGEGEGSGTDSAG